jgi:PAS domain S-box-containing protein
MPGSQSPHFTDYPFLRGGGQMGELIRAIDWDTNPLGSPANWPVALKQAVSMMLKNSFPVLICWGSDYIQLYNDAFRPINGATKHPQAMGGTAQDTYAEIWNTISPMFGEVMQGQTHGFPNFMVPLDRNGHTEDCYFDFSYSPIADIEGQGILVICVETTEKFRSIQELSESEARFRTMAEDSDMLIAVADESSNAVYFSKAWTEMTGRTMDYLLAFGWADLVHTEDRKRYLNLYLTSFEKKAPFTGEFRVLNNNGDYRWLLARNAPRFRPDGTFAGYISSCVDITERKNDEQQLQLMIDMLPASVVVIRGHELVVEMINQANLNYWNKTAAEVIGKPFLEILPDLADQPFAGQLRQVMDTGEIVDVKESPVLFENPDGSIRETFVDYTYQPLTNINGKRTGVLVMSSEITDRVLARRQVEQSEENLKAMIAQATGGYVYTNRPQPYNYSC